MPAEIVLVRHAETEANAAGTWQGKADAPVSEEGARQIARLEERLSGERFDVVISSDLGRAAATAEAAPAAASFASAWQEMDVGIWEGLTNVEVEQRFADEIAAVRRGDDLAYGGAERFSEFRGRVVAAYEELAAGLDDGQRALIVTHGGVIYALVSHILGTNLRGKAVRVSNTALTTLSITGWGPQVAVYNDVSHLDGEPLRTHPRATHLVLVRHGQTPANVEARWQGHSEGSLTETGREQASLLAAGFPEVDAMYSSPLGRALETASAVARTRATDPVVRQELKEIGFGAWESLTADEIGAADPEALERLRNGEDIARGGTGETFVGVRERMTAAIEGIADGHAGSTVAIFSHGGSLRAFATGLLGMDFADRYRLGILANTGTARVVKTRSSFMLGTWNLTPHLR
ncbi:MAG: histidine phosphatase family protein [Acidimicrobiia bacterium]